MPPPEPRPQLLDPPRSGGCVVWGLIVVCSLVFAGLTTYRVLSHDPNEVNPEKLAELASAAPRPDVKATQPGSEWPQWRGPNRDGVSTETDVRTDWPDGGPKVLWERKTGEGFSSVVVSNGRAFTMFQDGPDEAVVCWDAETGQERWRFKYPAQYKNDYGNGPRSTPAIAGDQLYAVGGTGIMHCLQAFTDSPAGEMVWRKDLLEEFGGELLTWGVAFSPLVEKGLVFVMPGGPGGNALAALEKDTGAVVWKDFDDRPSYSSPVAADLAGTRQIVFLTGERLVGVVPESGRLLWEFPWSAGAGHAPTNIATPLVIHLDVGDYVFVSSGYDKGCALLKIEPAGDGFRPVKVYANRNLRTTFASCVQGGDYLYGFDDTNLACLELRTGRAKWKERGFDKGSVLRAGGALIILGETGTLAVAEATPNGYREKARFQHSERPSSWTVPVLVGGRLYVRDRDRLVCYDLKKSP
jgi:outer membrane protein assembly factor BamB